MERDIQVADPDAAPRTEPVAGLVARTPFQMDGAHLRLFRVGAETAWHATPGALYGWVRAGAGRLDSPLDSHSLSAGDFVRIPGGQPRRFASGGAGQVSNERAGDDGDGDAGPLELLAVVDGDASVTAAAPQEGASADEQPEVVGPDDLAPAVTTPDLTRETPFPDDEDVLLLRVRAAGGAAAGRHHHGANLYFGYAVDGPSETEHEGGVARIERGEAFHVPPRLVHRDTNPTDATHTGIIWLCGGEPWVVNVDGP